jgi:hypothetical protein
MVVRSLVLSALCLSCASGMAQTPNNCEPLRLQIEQKIAANGVREFSVSVVDVEANVTGQVVGSCGQGRQKIIYLRGPHAAAPPARETAPVPQSNSGILTECKDGTVSMGGQCKP